MKTTHYFIIFFIIIIIFFKNDVYSDNNIPEIFVNDFYTWYIKKRLNTHDSPVYDHAIYKYVDNCLVKKLRLNLERGNAWSDYFTKSQDYLDTWPQTLKVYDATIIDNTIFVVPISLAENEKGASILVFLEKKNETFHIIKIKAIDRACYE